jgi:ubiquinone/menaquinone biosynthesis C-methylase UbiE
VSTSEPTPTIWSAGRYDAVGERIAPIAAKVVATAKRRGAFGDVADLACGTGNAALAAAAAGARVTAVDVTPEMVTIGAQKAKDAGQSITWVTADAADTGLPGGSFDAVVSNMGIIFVEPTRQVAEIARLLKSGGVVGFSSWVRDPENPFFAPIAAVLGPPPRSGYSPDQWGQADTITDRLAVDFDNVEIENGSHTWQWGTVEDAVRFVTRESPMSVSVLAHTDSVKRDQLIAAFEDTFRALVGSDGTVSYDAPYAVVTAIRR